MRHGRRIDKRPVLAERRAVLALDDRDIRILEILASEGRISKTELARRVNLSPTPCWDRLKRLEKLKYRNNGTVSRPSTRPVSTARSPR